MNCSCFLLSDRISLIPRSPPVFIIRFVSSILHKTECKPNNKMGKGWEQGYTRIVWSGTILQKWLHRVSNCIFCYLLLLPSGDFTDTSEMSAKGITGRVLLILSAVIQLLVWTVTFAAVAHLLLGLYAFIVCNWLWQTSPLALELQKPHCYFSWLW